MRIAHALLLLAGVFALSTSLAAAASATSLLQEASLQVGSLHLSLDLHAPRTSVGRPAALLSTTLSLLGFGLLLLLLAVLISYRRR